MFIHGATATFCQLIAGVHELADGAAVALSLHGSRDDHGVARERGARRLVLDGRSLAHRAPHRDRHHCVQPRWPRMEMVSNAAVKQNICVLSGTIDPPLLYRLIYTTRLK